MRSHLPATTAALLLAAAAAVSQTAPYVETAPTTGAAVRIAQPKAFADLAEKAGQVGGILAEGTISVEADKSVELSEELKQVAFKVWSAPEASKVELDGAAREVRLTDGKHVYTLRRRAGDGPIGRRRQLTQTNFYHALDLMAPLVDARKGYANLAGSVEFQPAQGPAELARRFPKATWFSLKAVAQPPHHLLSGAEGVIMGLGEDGLVRVMVARLQIKSAGMTVTVVYDKMTPAAVKADDLKLPADAAKAEWTDLDTRESVAVPKELVGKGP